MNRRGSGQGEEFYCRQEGLKGKEREGGYKTLERVKTS